MSKAAIISLIVIGIIVISVIALYFVGVSILDKQAKNWNTTELLINGELKNNIMKSQSLSEDQYMQCMVGVWVIANIEAEGIKKLMKLEEGSDQEKASTKKTIAKIQKHQKYMRICFSFTGKNIDTHWDGSYLSSLIKVLKGGPSVSTINDIERDVVNAFSDKHKNAEKVLKRKTNGGYGGLTFLEFAVKCVPIAFEQFTVASS